MQTFETRRGPKEIRLPPLQVFSFWSLAASGLFHDPTEMLCLLRKQWSTARPTVDIHGFDNCLYKSSWGCFSFTVRKWRLILLIYFSSSSVPLSSHSYFPPFGFFLMALFRSLPSSCFVVFDNHLAFRYPRNPLTYPYLSSLFLFLSPLSISLSLSAL